MSNINVAVVWILNMILRTSKYYVHKELIKRGGGALKYNFLQSFNQNQILSVCYQSPSKYCFTIRIVKHTLGITLLHCLFFKQTRFVSYKSSIDKPFLLRTPGSRTSNIKCWLHWNGEPFNIARIQCTCAHVSGKGGLRPGRFDSWFLWADFFLVKWWGGGSILFYILSLLNMLLHVRKVQPKF